ncbi:DUF2878 domain-containing protein [Kaarinaea lacus]
MQNTSADRKVCFSDTEKGTTIPYPKIANFLLFQIGWFACVLVAAQELPLLALISSLTIVAIHMLFTSFKGRELILILFSASLGMVVDSVAIASHVFTVPNSQGLFLAPLWLISLWMLFATCLRHSMSWLQGRYTVSAICGALFAPLAYYGGSQLGAIEISQSDIVASLAFVSIAWALVMPLLIWFVKLQDN